MDFVATVYILHVLVRVRCGHRTSFCPLCSTCKCDCGVAGNGRFSCDSLRASFLVSACQVCTVYGGFPTHWEFWVVNVGSAVAATVAGEIFCMRKEMEVMLHLKLRFNSARCTQNERIARANMHTYAYAHTRFLRQATATNTANIAVSHARQTRNIHIHTCDTDINMRMHMHTNSLFPAVSVATWSSALRPPPHAAVSPLPLHAACLPACLHACLPACPSAACLPVCISACPPACFCSTPPFQRSGSIRRRRIQECVRFAWCRREHSEKSDVAIMQLEFMFFSTFSPSFPRACVLLLAFRLH